MQIWPPIVGFAQILKESVYLVWNVGYPKIQENDRKNIKSPRIVQNTPKVYYNEIWGHWPTRKVCSSDLFRKSPYTCRKKKKYIHTHTHTHTHTHIYIYMCVCVLFFFRRVFRSKPWTKSLRGGLWPPNLTGRYVLVTLSDCVWF